MTIPWLPLGRIRPWVRPLGIICVCLACVRLFSDMEWSSVWSAMSRVPLTSLLGVIGLHGAVLVCKAFRWRALLGPSADIPLWRAVQYVFATTVAGLVLPRGQELSFVAILSGRERVPPSSAVMLVLIEKLFEGIGLMFVVAPLPWLLPLPGALATTVKLLVLGGCTVTVVALVVARSDALTARVSVWRGFSGFREGTAVLRALPRFLLCVLYSVGAYLLDCLAIGALIAGVGAHVPWPAAALVELSQVTSLLFPSPPLMAGTLELASVAPLLVLGVPSATAAAFAAVFHLVVLVWALPAGWIALRLFGKRAGREQSSPLPLSGAPPRADPP